MRFIETPIGGAYVVEPTPRVDERGSFTRLWCAREFAERRLPTGFVQCNTSTSVCKATLRGLHYQMAPYGEIKLVRCTRGSVYDVVVDVRPRSATFLSWHGVELSAANGRMMYVAEGLAHGYLTLEDDSEVTYPVSQFYEPSAERGVRWDDPRIRIAWPIQPLHVSPKDRAWPDVAPDLALEPR